MGSEAIRHAIETATEYLRQHPDEARSTDSAATASIVDGLIVRVTGPGGASITTDMVPSVGGTASAVSPGWLLRAAEASCVVTLIAMRAAVLGVTIDTLEVTVGSVSDDRGMLGAPEGVHPGPTESWAHIIVSAKGTPEEKLKEVVRWAEEHSPVTDSLCRAVPHSLKTELP